MADLPVPVITHHASAEHPVSALKAGALDHIPQPGELDQLRGLAKAALAGSVDGKLVWSKLAEKRFPEWPEIEQQIDARL